MKIYYTSDLHLDIGSNKSFMIPPIEDEKSSILVLAGDISHANNYKFFEHFFDDISNRFKRIFIIAGNHEFYTGDFCDTSKRLYKFFTKYTNIDFLDNSKIVFDGIDIIGTTLWSDIPEQKIKDVQRGLNDYMYITCGDTMLTPYATRNKFLDNIKFLEAQTIVDNKTVWILHHAPSFKSISEKYASHSLNVAYVSDLEDMIIKLSPNIIIHGHTHSPSNYFINHTQVRANPRGYPGENADFEMHVVNI